MRRIPRAATRRSETPTTGGSMLTRQTVLAVITLLSTTCVLKSRPDAAPSGTSPGDALVVHEWGTYTVLQDENGKFVGGINTDDEPLTAFVHQLNGELNGPSSPLPP